MPRGDGTGPGPGGGGGGGGGRGRGLGRGQMGRPTGAGVGGNCVCPGCGYRTPHVTGEPCNQKRCPTCGKALVRE